VALLVAAAMSCGSSEPNGDCPSAGAAATVTMTTAGFTPMTVTIAVGQSVCWQNATRAGHTVTSDDKTSFNGALSIGGTFTHQFAAAGAFPYHSAADTTKVGLVTVVNP
jgi:plastocyanin